MPNSKCTYDGGEEPEKEPVPIPVDEQVAKSVEKLYCFQCPGVTEREAVGALIVHGIRDYEEAFISVGLLDCDDFLG